MQSNCWSGIDKKNKNIGSNFITDGQSDNVGNLEGKVSQCPDSVSQLGIAEPVRVLAEPNGEPQSIIFKCQRWGWEWMRFTHSGVLVH